MPFDRKAREAAEITYYRTVANLKPALTDPDIKFLYQQHPVGIHPKGLIILRAERGAAKPPPHYRKLLEAVSSDIALHSRHNLIIGATLQNYSHSCEKYSPYKDTLYLPHYFVNMTLPQRRKRSLVFRRHNGDQTLKLIADDRIGLPYGVYARLVLIYVTTERVRTKERKFELGTSWRRFLEKMKVIGSGPKIQAIQEQLRRLCGTTYKIFDESDNSESFSQLLVAEKWMRSKDGIQVTLSPGFFMMTGDSIVPLESRIVHKLRRSSLTLDLYAWLSYRLFRLKEESFIPWHKLEPQFGADYSRPRDFRSKFQMSLEKVLHYKPPTPIVQVQPKGLYLSPGASSDVEWMERMVARACSSTRHPILI